MKTKDMVHRVGNEILAAVDNIRFEIYARSVKLLNPNAVVMRGKWDFVLRNELGFVKEQRTVPFCNVITTAGLAFLADFLYQGSAAFTMKYLAVGTGGTAESAAQTALVTEIGTRVTGTKSNPSGAIYQVTGTFAAANGTGAITEAGTFSASSSGTMMNRKLFSVINKAAGDSLDVTMQITFS